MVKIANPVPGGCDVISQTKADKYIRRGQAQMSECGAFLMLTGKHHLAACRNVSLEQEMGYDRAANGELGRLDEVMTLLHNEPVLLPSKCLTIPSKRSVSRRPAHGKVAHIFGGGKGSRKPDYIGAATSK